MPTTLAGQVPKHCNYVVNSPDENNNIGGVYTATPFLEDYEQVYIGHTDSYYYKVRRVHEFTKMSEGICFISKAERK